MRRVVVVAWSLGLAACGFDGAPVGTVADARVSDGRVAGDAADAMPDAAVETRPRCATTMFLDEEFDSNTPCNGWATSYRNGNAMLTQMDGELHPQPGNPNTSAGCAEAEPHGWSAVLVQLEEAIVGDGNYTSFQLLGLRRALGVVNRDLVFEALEPSTVIARVPYDPEKMEWLQLRRGPGGDVIAEYSEDGQTWTAIGARATPAGPMRLNLIGGYTSGTNASGDARFDRLVICD